jgi:tryptophan synthase alpha chain
MTGGALPVAGTDTIAAAFAAAPGRAALMPYLMGGFPDLDSSRAIGEAYAEAGADLVELGVPFSDPLADGPVIHAADTAALAAGATLHGVLEVGRTLSESVPVVLMCYANLVFARGQERFADELAERGISGLIVPDLPLEEADDTRAACDAAGVALVPLVAPTTPDERLAAIGRSARGVVYAVAVTGTTGERQGLGDELAAMLGRTKAHADVPVALGFGIATPAAAAAAADAGADGVVIGSRLVRAAGEAADPAAAVRDLVGEFAAALR